MHLKRRLANRESSLAARRVRMEPNHAPASAKVAAATTLLRFGRKASSSTTWPLGSRPWRGRPRSGGSRRGGPAER